MVRLYALCAALAFGAIACLAAYTTKGVGQRNAPVVIELFSDYQCPSCKTMHEQVISQLMTDYVRKGKVYLIHREFPLPMHAHAKTAAAYAAAAYRVGKYEQVGDALFANQAQWSVTGKVDETVARALSPAEWKRVRELSTKPEIQEEIAYELGLGHNASVNQTPTMLIEHKGKKYPVKGGVTYTVLQKFIDDLLKK